MYALSVPPVMQALTQARHLAGTATPAMLSARLHPDMFDCATQFRTVASFALRATFPLTGLEAPKLPKGGPFVVLTAAQGAVGQLTPADFDGAKARRVQHRAGFADLDQSAQDYLQLFALPNLWFHLSMAFAIMRMKGAGIGKADFDGLHGYPQGFSF